MKNWRSFFKESLKKEHVEAQLKPGSYLWRMFIFSAVAAISLGVIYNFVYKYIGGTKAATENVVVTAGASKPQVALNEEFTVNVLFSGANAKKISQLDVRLNVAPEGSAAVSYVPTKITSTAVGGSTKYFDEIVLERPATDSTNVRLVFSSTKADAELSDRVIVKMTFKGTANGRVNFSVDQSSLEVVGPGGENVPTSFTVGTGSNVNTRVDIGGGPSATPISTVPTIITPSVTPPAVTPGITITPAPACIVGQSNSCPTGSTCGTGGTCSCDTGKNNCDNNWANGCETTGLCQGGGICTANNQCTSGQCVNNICSPNGAIVTIIPSPTDSIATSPTTIPSPSITSTISPGTTTPTAAVASVTPAGPTKIPSGGACGNSNECSNGFACTSGKCMPVFCDGQHSCPGGYSCKQGVCFPGACSNTNTCPNRYTCQTPENICMPQPKCGADLPCAPGYSCTEGGICQKSSELGQCTENNQCSTNGQCINNNCFCTQGTYNCDRNWANGCEGTSPCQGSGTAKVTVRAKFNGIGANIEPADSDMKVTVMLANKYLLAPVERTVTMQARSKDARNIDIYEGTFDVNTIPFGSDYTVFVKGEQHLQKRVCEATPEETVDGRYICSKGVITIKEGENVLDFGDIYMLAGDLPISNEQSGFIDAVDMVFIRANLGSTDPELLPIGDLNKDGIIDVQDHSLAVYALSFKYDDIVIED